MANHGALLLSTPFFLEMIQKYNKVEIGNAGNTLCPHFPIFMAKIPHY